jgi:DNA-binding NtrC family response regulator
MQTHHGAIDVQSTLGHGSQFTLYFPITQQAAFAAIAEPTVTQDIQGKGKRILYVDDDQALVFLVMRALTRKGFDVTIFTDPLEAQAALEDTSRKFDLLVTDYNMPGYSGLDLLRAARRIRPDLLVALASGYVTAEIEKSAMEAGARALIYKPNDISELCETVQRLVDGSDAA